MEAKPVAANQFGYFKNKNQIEYARKIHPEPILCDSHWT